MMNREQVKKLFQLLGNTYPQFMPTTPEKLKDKINTWADIMKDMDYEHVIARARQHVQEHKFPPTIAEISAYAPKKDNTLEKMREWEREASKVPDHVKEDFRKRMKKLFEDKAK